MTTHEHDRPSGLDTAGDREDLDDAHDEIDDDADEEVDEENDDEVHDEVDEEVHDEIHEDDTAPETDWRQPDRDVDAVDDTDLEVRDEGADEEEEAHGELPAPDEDLGQHDSAVGQHDGDGHEDDSVLLTESTPGSVLPPEGQPEGEPETTEAATEAIPSGAAPSPLERLEPAGSGSPIDPGTGSFRERWGAIQAGFIDDPRSTVESASSLLTEMWVAVEQSVTEERRGVDAQWRESERSTDDLRAVMKDYRGIYSRLVDLVT